MDIPTLMELAIRQLVQLDDRQLRLELASPLPLELLGMIAEQLPTSRHYVLASCLSLPNQVELGLNDPSCKEQLLNAAYRGDLESVARLLPLVEEQELNCNYASSYDEANNLTSHGQNFLTLSSAISSGGHISLMELLPVDQDETELLAAAGAGGQTAMIDYLLARYGYSAATLSSAMEGAAASGEVELFTRLLGIVADRQLIVDEPYDSYADNAMRLATCNGQVEIVAFINSNLELFGPSLEDAARSGKVEMLEMVDLDEVNDASLEDALWQAKGHPAATAWLLAKAEERGLAAPNDLHALNRLICDRGNCVDSPACLSLHRPRSINLEQFNIPWLNESIRELLLSAARYGLLSIVSLIAGRADDVLLNDAAVAAIHGGHLEIVQWIAEHLADRLESERLIKRAAAEDRLLILQLLLRQSAQIDSALSRAAEGGALRIIRYLSTMTKLGQESLDSALAVAAGNNNPKTVRLLIELGANPTSGITSAANRPNILNLLLEASSKPIDSSILVQALDSALTANIRESIVALVAAGADVSAMLLQAQNARVVMALFRMAKELRIDVSSLGKVAAKVMAEGKPEIATEIKRQIELFPRPHPKRGKRGR